MKIEHDPYLKKITDNADMVLVDGKPLIWVSKIHKNPVKAKISGSDLVPLLCAEAAHNGYSMFIIGGKEGIAEKAKIRLEERHLQADQVQDDKIHMFYPSCRIFSIHTFFPLYSFFRSHYVRFQLTATIL